MLNRHANIQHYDNIDLPLFGNGAISEDLKLKVLVPIHSLIPPTFFKHIEILVPKVESYLKGLMCEI